MDALNHLFQTLKVSVKIFHNGQYCGRWAVDTSGSHFINFHLVTAGQCFLKMSNQDKVTPMKEGDLVIFPRDSQHQLVSIDDENVPVNKASSVSFDDGVLQDGTGLLCGFFSHQHPIVHHLTEHLPDVILLRAETTNPSALKHLISGLIVEARQTKSHDSWMMNQIAEPIMALLFRDHLVGPSGILSGISNPKLRLAITAVQTNPSHKWTVEILAKESVMSRTAFSEAFKKTVGMTPMAFVTYWRLSLAYTWLLEDKKTVLESALACGYDNEASFSKALKRELGITPGELRKKMM